MKLRKKDSTDAISQRHIKEAERKLMEQQRKHQEEEATRQQLKAALEHDALSELMYEALSLRHARQK
jgi:hypothetical protein